jgi:hypothetical protein
MHMRIMQGHEVIADLPDWDAPIPRVGDYIFHPPYGSGSPGIAGCVKTVTWRTHDRPADRNAKRFVQTEHPYVEITI